MVKTQLGGSPLNRYFKHEKSGRVFELLYITNEHARAIKRDTWQITAVYRDQNERIWSSSLIDFEKKFVEIDSKTGARI